MLVQGLRQLWAWSSNTGPAVCSQPEVRNASRSWPPARRRPPHEAMHTHQSMEPTILRTESSKGRNCLTIGQEATQRFVGQGTQHSKVNY